MEVLLAKLIKRPSEKARSTKKLCIFFRSHMAHWFKYVIMEEFFDRIIRWLKLLFCFCIWATFYGVGVWVSSCRGRVGGDDGFRGEGIEGLGTTLLLRPIIWQILITAYDKNNRNDKIPNGGWDARAEDATRPSTPDDNLHGKKFQRNFRHHFKFYPPRPTRQISQVSASNYCLPSLGNIIADKTQIEQATIVWR